MAGDRQVNRRVAVHADVAATAKKTGIPFYVDGLMSGFADAGIHRRLDESGVRMTAFMPALRDRQQQAASPAPDWSRAGIGVDTAGVLPHATTLPWHPAYAPSRVLRAWRARRVEQRWAGAVKRYDLLHVTFPSRLALAADVTRTATIYDISTVLYPQYFPADWPKLWEGYFSFCLRECDRILTISASVKNEVVSHFGFPADQIDVTPLAARPGVSRIADSLAAQRLADAGLPADDFVLYVGSLEPRKGIVTLLRAFADATKDAPGVRLVLAGAPWQGMGETVEEKVSGLGIATRVVRPGYVSDDLMNALLTRCSVFAYLSEYEGFGLPPLEAMTCGVPVVTTSASSLPEVVGDAALTVPPGDDAAAAGALRTALFDDAERERLRAAGPLRAQEFSWARTAALTLDSYERSLAAL